MKKVILFVLYFLATIFNISANNTTLNNIWEEANDAYKNEQYQHAVDLYESIIEQKITNASTYYNLGNAYYRLNKTGKAIIYYSKALKENPNFKEAQQNIAFIENNGSIEENNLATFGNNNAWDIFLNYFHSNFWAWFSAILFLLTSIIYIIYKKNKIAKAINILMLSLGASCLLFFTLNKMQYQFKNVAVVINDKSFLYNDLKKSKVIFNIPEGCSIKVIDNKSNDKSIGLVKIRLNNGFEGWIDESDIEKI